MDCIFLIRAADQMFEQNDLAFNEKTEKVLSFLRSVGVIPIRRASVNSHHHVRFSGMLVAALEQDTTVDLRSRKQSTLHDMGVTTVLIRWLDNAVEQGILVPANCGDIAKGALQFGDARLQDYQAATDTSFTQDEFKANSALQDKVAAWHIADIDKTIDGLGINTDGYDRDGLRAVAHLGGKGGMKKFVQSAGKYNPSDELGTSLQDYYDKFAIQS